MAEQRLFFGLWPDPAARGRLANRLGRLGRGLKAGDLISTGTCAEIYHAEAGERIRAEFGPVGSIELTF